MKPPFELVLFSTDPSQIRPATAAGIQAIIVDWEFIGKTERQLGADTQINRDTLDDLRRVRACTDARVLCRLNRFGDTTPVELEQAVEAGADEVLLPMVTSPAEVEAVLAQASGRVGTGILVETQAALSELPALSRLPLSRVYVGLNDLAIERGSPNLFVALLDGTVDRIRAAFEVPFGFGGLTLPEAGEPIPCRLLLREMMRLRCHFSFLRRSYHRDMEGRDPAIEVPRLLATLDESRRRSPEEIDEDRSELQKAIRRWMDADRSLT
ncbi:hypothetical protein ACFL59_01785 [Planctomycetota bacterium]